jgi:hypothetical protein
MPYTVHRVDVKADRERILAVWERIHGETLEPKFDWIYRDNPAGSASVWLLHEEASHQDVGTAAIFPRTFHMQGRNVRAGIAGDLAVHEAHRHAGPAVLLKRAVAQGAWESGFRFLYGFPNAQAEPVMKRVGYRRLGGRARYVKILRSGSYLASSRASFARRAGVAADLLVEANDRLVMAMTGGSYTAAHTESVDERFDVLWAELARGDAPIMGARDARYLRWRYAARGASRHGIFTLCERRSGALRGYLIHSARGSGIVIRDVLAPAPSVRAALLATFSMWARAHGALALSLVALRSAALERRLRLRRHGFFLRPDRHHIFTLIPPHPQPEEPSLGNADSWYLLQADDDLP